jgi:hypothetical protein
MATTSATTNIITSLQLSFLIGSSLFLLPTTATAFTISKQRQDYPSYWFRYNCGGGGGGSHRPSTTKSTALFVYAPPGSGYAGPEDPYDYDTTLKLPETYEPLMAYPGTMRPGKTPENMPFQDLPIGDEYPNDPVPWPHFQQIEFHHRWEPPHPHPGTMEHFIEINGRWATPEEEAAMRAGTRRGVRQLQQELAQRQQQQGGSGAIITDDEEDELRLLDTDDFMEKEEPLALGEGIFGRLGSDADRAATAATVSPSSLGTRSSKVDDDVVVVEEGEEEDGLDDFLLDLGLDADDDDEEEEREVDVGDDDDDDDEIEKGSGTGGGGGGVTASIHVVEDEEDDLATLGLDDDEDDDLNGDGVSTVPLDDFGDNDTFDNEDIFDEGGFDFDDGDFVGGDDDMW